MCYCSLGGHAGHRVEHSRLHEAGFSQNIKNITKTWMMLFMSNNEVFAVHPGTSPKPCRYEEESEAAGSRQECRFDATSFLI